MSLARSSARKNNKSVGNYNHFDDPLREPVHKEIIKGYEYEVY
jgi:hypothetical protein